MSTRTDFMVVFVYLLAYKLDSDASLSWTVRLPHLHPDGGGYPPPHVPAALAPHPRHLPPTRRTRTRVQVTFIFGFWWVTVSILIGICALMVFLSGRRARIWQPAGLRVRAANAAAHLAAVLLLAALILLLAFMRSGHDLRSPADVRRLRGCLGCVATWISASAVAHVVMWAAQREREALRRRQVTDGRVWTAVYNSLSSSATIARQVDSLSPEEIAQKVPASARARAAPPPQAAAPL